MSQVEAPELVALPQDVINFLQRVKAAAAFNSSPAVTPLASAADALLRTYVPRRYVLALSQVEAREAAHAHNWGTEGHDWWPLRSAEHLRGISGPVQVEYVGHWWRRAAAELNEIETAVWVINRTASLAQRFRKETP